VQKSINGLQERLKELQGCEREEDGVEMRATRMALQALLDKKDMR
jgi:hypothetical protein